MELDSLRSLVTRVPVPPVSFDELGRRAVTSTPVAWTVIAGLPVLGFLASLFARLPLFAALMAACFLLATALVCHKALVRFASRTMQILVTARVVVIVVVAGLLFCTTGTAWMAVVSAVLLWLASDRLIGRAALTDLADHAESDEAPMVRDGANPLFQPVQDDPTGSRPRPRRKGSAKV